MLQLLQNAVVSPCKHRGQRAESFLWSQSKSRCGSTAAVRGGCKNRETNTLVYSRLKTGPQARLSINTNLWAILEQLPKAGPLFPAFHSSKDNLRASEFYYLCKRLKIDGMTLHSYRYAWDRTRQDLRSSEHTSTAQALIQILSGRFEFTRDGQQHVLKAGDLLNIPPHLPHAVKAPEKFSMLLTLLRQAQPAPALSRVKAATPATK